MKKLNLLVLVAVLGITVPNFGISRPRIYATAMAAITILSGTVAKIINSLPDSNESTEIEINRKLTSLIKKTNNSNLKIKGEFDFSRSPHSGYRTIFLPYRTASLFDGEKSVNNYNKKNLKAIIQHEIGHLKVADFHIGILCAFSTAHVFNFISLIEQPSVIKVALFPATQTLLYLTRLAFLRFQEFKADDNIEPKYIPEIIILFEKWKKDYEAEYKKCSLSFYNITLSDIFCTHPDFDKRINRLKQRLAYSKLTEEEKQQKEDNYNQRLFDALQASENEVDNNLGAKIIS